MDQIARHENARHSPIEPVFETRLVFEAQFLFKARLVFKDLR